MNEPDLDFEQIIASEFDPKRVNKAISYACRVLGMREYSEKSLRLKLKQKSYESIEIEKAIEFLLENNWLSDQRFCEVFIRSKINKGQGLSRIQYELNQKGITQSLIDQSLLKQDINWQKICNEVTIRKVNSVLLENNMKDRQRLERFLRYRGFSGEQIRKSIQKYINK
jgi:regulatory protein